MIQLPGPPSRLGTLVAETEGRELKQPGLPFARAGWLAALPKYERLLNRFPTLLSRESVREFSLSLSEEHFALGTFLASQIWGYGSRGYARFRLARALDAPNIDTLLQVAVSELRGGHATAAFRTLCVDAVIPWVGTSFASKFLFFADQRGHALILDSVVALWLRRHARIGLSTARSLEDYSYWLQLAASWSDTLQLPRNRIELLIFNDGLPPSSPWRI